MARSFKRVRTIEDLWPYPLAYDRAALMEHIRRYDREELRAYYLRQPVEGAHVWANYVVNLWEYEHGVEELTSYPWNITIPITEICNATCAFCSSPLVPNPKALAVHEVQHFAEPLKHAVRVSLQGLGEPLAHPQFEEIAAEIRKHLSPVAQLEIITNGWLLSGHRWELLKSLRISHLQVSVNAATDRTHQVAMGSRPGTFERVLQNIDSVLADPDWSGLLKVSMVITRHSLPEVPQFLEILADRGVKRFQFNPLLPLTTPDWGFGRTDQYLDLWCGHLPDASRLVERAAAAISDYRGKGMWITADPDQWLLPVRPSVGNLIQLTTEQQGAAAFQASSAPAIHAAEYDALHVQLDDQRVALGPHEIHTEVSGGDSEGVTFRGTPESCRWAYLFRSSRISLPPGDYALELGLDVAAGGLYGGILDIEENDFIVQEELRSGSTRIGFTLTDRRVIDVVVRQGPDDTPIRATYRHGRLVRAMNAQEPGEPLPPAPPREAAADVPVSEACHPPEAEGVVGESSKPGRIYCPMVYTTLSVFHHSLDVSICCYMENAPARRSPNLKTLPVLQVYNADAFRLVRRTLNSERHIPVCDSCQYGASRS